MRIAVTLAILVGTLLGVVAYGCAQKPKPDRWCLVTLYSDDSTATRRWWTRSVGSVGAGWMFYDADTGECVRVSGNVVIDEIDAAKTETPGVRQ